MSFKKKTPAKAVPPSHPIKTYTATCTWKDNKNATPIVNMKPIAGMFDVDPFWSCLLFRGKKESLWKFWNHGVTGSFVDRFQDCRKQTELAYVDGWTPRNTNEGLEFGTLGHKIMERAYKLAKPRKFKIDQWIEEYEQEWRTAIPNPTEAQLAQQELIYAKAQAILPAYFQRYDGDFLGKYTVPFNGPKPVSFLATEGEFCIPYIFPDGYTTYFRGMRDIVFLDKAGGHWISDYKFLSVIDARVILATMQCNFQLWGYMYSYMIETGLVPKGAILNIIRRPATRYNPAKETLHEYMERTTIDCADPEKYPINFLRIAMAVTKQEILDWKKYTLDPIMDDVRGWWEGRYPNYRSPKHVAGKYGLCDLFMPLVENNFTNVYKRTRPFNELMGV